MELYRDCLEDTLHHPTLRSSSMSSTSSQFASPRKMGIYETNHQIGMWGNSLNADSSQNTASSAMVDGNVHHGGRLEDGPHTTARHSKKYDQEANKPAEKVLRRLAQNREAARKSRLRKKAYVQQLESSRVKLAQMEQELGRARQQGVYIGGNSGESTLGLSGSVNSGVTAFEMEYAHWVEEQNRQTNELRAALQAHVSDIELRMLVENGLNHYDNLFRIKAIAGKSDVFYIMSGMWKTAAERFFLWIGGFRPSELLKVLLPQLDPLTEQQVLAVCNLQQSSAQAEDALSQGMDKLQQTLAESLASDASGSNGVANYMGQMVNAMGKLEAFVNFVNQADNLRQQALQQMYKILTVRQAARGLLALGDYCQRLRALSSLWTARPREPA
ncbi:transcription factor TGA4-like isoform X1 [Zingiber officinale]|uniref:transcription factor TGA4-like isoform X1 n=1 Tax=Zingiber officinale TaxID=94328 RepID=UPI001C4D7CF7|nr:transcription factor TGA4-like isoform X1 [Zingiber officinale]XP_042377100.1 transcription factor TGA4-like isoform X1 [Zingiber officinale]